jgi:hypothetical protein
MFRREVFTQISAQAVPKPQTTFSHQVGSGGGAAEKTRQLAARNPSAAVAAANAPQIVAKGWHTLPCLSQPQVHYPDHRSAPVLGTTRKIWVSLEYGRVSSESHPDTFFLTYDPMWRKGHISCAKTLNVPHQQPRANGVI